MSDVNAAGGFTHALSDGNQIPALGLGVWQVPDGPRVRRTRCAGRSRRATATSTPPRPTATRQSVGQGAARQRRRRARTCSSRRSSIRAARTRWPRLERSLERLGVDSRRPLHHPLARRAARRGHGRAWSAHASRVRPLDRRLELQRRRARRGDRRRDGPPVVNQVQFSPFEYRRRCCEACAERASRSRPTARSAPADIWRRTVAEIAERLGRTPAQVLIRWSCSTSDRAPEVHPPERIDENAQVFDFELSDEDMVTLDALDRTGGTEQARERKWW